MELQNDSIHGKKLRNTASRSTKHCKNSGLSDLLLLCFFFAPPGCACPWLFFFDCCPQNLLLSSFCSYTNMRSSGFWQGPECTPPSPPIKTNKRTPPIVITAISQLLRPPDLDDEPVMMEKPQLAIKLTRSNQWFPPLTT